MFHMLYVSIFVIKAILNQKTTYDADEYDFRY